MSRARALTGGRWVVQVALALVFLGAGAAKLAGSPDMVEMFDQVGAGQWLRLVVGAAEVAGAVGLLVPALTASAALGLALLMVGAAVANLTVLDDSPVLTVVLAVAAGTVAWLRRDRIRPHVGGRDRRERSLPGPAVR